MLTPSSFQTFLGQFPIQIFQKGQTLLFQGEVPRRAFVVASGIVLAYNISPLGEEQLVSLSGEHDILPVAWVLGEAKVAYYFYEAFTDVRAYAVPRDSLLQAVDTSPELAKFLLHRFMSLYVGASVRINALEQPRSRDKIIHLLYYLMIRFGQERQKDRFYLTLKLTHLNLAGMLGITRETIATELARLRREGVVEYKQQVYIIDRPKLLQMRNDDDLITNL
jgi:CRP-like cAMP-binding protein